MELVHQVQQRLSQHPKYKWAEGVLTRKGKLVVGSTLQTRAVILEWLQLSPVGGHLGVKATEKMIKSLFYWNGMLEDIKAYILRCMPCLSCKNENIASPGLLQPLSVL